LGGPAPDGVLWEAKPDGSPPIARLSGFAEPLQTVFDGASFFVTQGAIGAGVWRVPRSGGVGFAFGLEKGGGVESMALDEECLYWGGFQGVFSLSRAAADVAAE